MAREQVLITMELMNNTEEKEVGSAFIEILTKNNLGIEFADLAEPVKAQVSSDAQFVEEWWGLRAHVAGGLKEGSPWPTFFKRRSKPAYRGNINHSFVNKIGDHLPGRFTFRGAWKSDIDWFEIFGDWVEALRPNLAILHIFGDSKSDAEGAGVAWSDFLQGYITSRQSPYFSKPYWAMAINNEILESRFDGTVPDGVNIFLRGGCSIFTMSDQLEEVLTEAGCVQNKMQAFASHFKVGTFGSVE